MLGNFLQCTKILTFTKQHHFILNIIRCSSHLKVFQTQAEHVSLSRVASPWPFSASLGGEGASTYSPSREKRSMVSSSSSMSSPSPLPSNDGVNSSLALLLPFPRYKKKNSSIEIKRICKANAIISHKKN